MPKRKVFDSDDDGQEDDTLFKAFEEGANFEEDDSSPEDQDLLAAEIESDDDDMPEAMGFKESKQAVLDTVKAAIQQIGQQKQTEKDKRKMRQDMYSTQRKEKLDALDKLRLPDEVLDSIEEKPLKKKKQKKEKKVEEEVEEETEDVDDGINITAEDLALHLDSEDFIPVESGEAGVKAVCLQEERKKPCSNMQKAVNFRNGRLNNKNIPRQSSKSMIQQWEKTRIRKTLVRN